VNRACNLENVVGNRPYKIYCAGPLFNPKEREEMQEIATFLEKGRYKVFLPHRDGLEFSLLFPSLLEKGVESQRAKEILNKAIFSLDVFQINDSNGLILNLNGRVPDEGAMVEAGIAWACNKVIVTFRTDSRSLIEGICNPMILGLSDFYFVTKYEDIPQAFHAEFSKVEENLTLSRPPYFDSTAKDGKEISEFLALRKPSGDITDLLIKLFRERTCQISKGLKKSYSPASMPQ
jgi:nucleoside 2-deoxyribosyltransferase